MERIATEGRTYLTAKVMIFDVAARPEDPANCHTTLQEPAERVLMVAKLKIPPVLSCGTTETIEQIAGVAEVSINGSPMLNRPEFCPFE